MSTSSIKPIDAIRSGMVQEGESLFFILMAKTRQHSLSEQVARSWEVVFTQLYTIDRLDLFYAEILSRIDSAYAFASQPFLKCMETILTQKIELVDIFIEIAKTDSPSYYNHGEFVTLLQHFCRFLERAHTILFLPSSTDVPCYDQGGKEWLESWTQTCEAGAHQLKDVIPGPDKQEPNKRIDIRLKYLDALSEEEYAQIEEIFSTVCWKAPPDDPELLPDFVASLLVVKKLLGTVALSMLINSASYQHAHDLEIAARVMRQVAIVARSGRNLNPLIQPFREGRITLQEMTRELQKTIVELSESSCPEGDIREKLCGFASLSNKERSELEQEYHQVYELGRTLRLAGIDELVRQAVEIRARSSHDAIGEGDTLLLIAIAREAIRKEFGIYPYNTQVLALLGLIHHPAKLRGKIAQVRTGEGKSTIIAMLALFYACQGLTVDVVSSSRYLSQRDEEKYRHYFKTFSIQTSHLCTDLPTAINFKGQVIYATNYDLEFAVMRDYFCKIPMRVFNQDGKTIPRPFEVVIVDEVDNLFIDSALNSARIAIHGRTSLKAIYGPILDFVKQNMNRISSCVEHESFLDDPILGEARKLIDPFLSGKEEFQVPGLSKLEELLRSAWEALRLKEDEDYVIKPIEREIGSHHVEKGVVIVDKANTGRLAEKSRWHHGLHQFVEAKHALPIEDESATIASLCHPVYFSQYSKLYGVTGTIGTEVEKTEISNIYKVAVFEVPPHNPNRREEMPATICISTEKHIAAIIDEVMKMRAAERPSLVLFETIQHTNSFAVSLKKQGVTCHILNARQDEDEAYLIARAGAPGAVTIATNTAGRGTDIILTPKSLSRGGLHVIFAYLPGNKRVEQQGFGRAGRQGQPGSARMVVHVDSSADTMGKPPSFEDLLLKRDLEIAKNSLQRTIRAHIETINHSYLKVFIHQLAQWQKAFDDQFLERVFELMEKRLQESISPPKTTLGADETRLQDAFFKTVRDRDPTGRRLFYRSVVESLLKRIQVDWAERFYNLLDEGLRFSSDPILTYQQTSQAFYDNTKRSWEQFFRSPHESYLEYLETITGSGI